MTDDELKALANDESAPPEKRQEAFLEMGSRRAAEEDKPAGFVS